MTHSEAELRLFEEFFRTYYSRLCRYAENFLNDKDEASDLVQDAFYQVWKNRTQLKKEKNLAPYIFTILKNKCLDRLKHKVIEKNYTLNQVKYEAEELYTISFLEKEEFVSVNERLHNELVKVINEMPPRCRTAFKLKWMEGKKIREIAEIMRISTTMVDKHLAKGLEIARNKMHPLLFMIFITSPSEC